MRHALPYAAPGQVIGLLGGSFDPAHDGHVHITREALKRFGLDRVWWLVSPGNPLKKHGPAPMDDRLRHAREVMVHPRVEVTDLERRTGTRYTAETLAALQRLYPQVRFVWLMGADNLAEFHRWDNWRWIMDHVPVGVIARPGDRVQARMSVAALIYRNARLRGRDAQRLANSKAPAWTLINAPMRDISSSQIRAKGHW
ncbi:nicotinate-nucleotide adenylyltransferase [Aliiroseovarius crassostreae]|uniref:nicotinate-nucleotide adenylyltransferase n=1 Tax=Aliiroseovarius crassostreae TaxID=154981 RepID=UPI0022014D7A|nr:nicotinate-nucleotide adenylyltransferase [Aliiroseovarius crassostreae]UWP89924.1 nicotinate-nucleotide adenylyltransferase [Aliiroseovarius crassostreae]UWP93083.1 nicotinate-nucleotide adenylyltransferase [Aliiroseovarius crassostreae]